MNLVSFKNNVDVHSLNDSPSLEESPVRGQRILVPATPARCPHCHAVIYARRHNLCGVCFRVLPRELLFSASGGARVKELLRMERVRHRGWLARR
jgi:hypothetical protein